jgi:hypothetical protein
MILNLISEYVDYSFEFMIECFNPNSMKKNFSGIVCEMCFVNSEWLECQEVLHY